MTTQEVYTAARALPLPERLRLAALILDDLSQISLPLLNPQDLPGFSSVWTEEDIRDFSAHSARYADTAYPEDESLLPPPEELERLKVEQAHV